MRNLQIMKKTFFTGLILALLMMPLTVEGQSGGIKTQKKKITSIDQLPRHTYRISGTITEMISDDKAFAAFAQQVRQDIENDFANYDIQDNATLSEYYGILLILDLLQENYDVVFKGIQRMRELEDKPAAKLMTALTEEVIALARQKTKTTGGSQFKETFARILAEKVKEFPWETVQERIVSTKGAMDMYSKNLLLGLIRSSIEPALKRSGYISGDMARQVIVIYYVIQEVMPLKEQIIEVYGNLIKANRIEKVDIWKERNVDLTGKKGLSPVLVAIWDTGVDTTVFPHQLFTNPKEKLDGKDNDANGFVDDVHGIAYTLEADKTTGLLYRIEGEPQPLAKKINLLRGFIDLQNAVDSPESAALKKKLAAMQPGQVKTFVENLMQMLFYMHGTHVAGIAIDGNPYVHILTVRSTFDYRMIPKPMTMEIAHKTAKMYKGVVDYLKANGVRVVNMSWSNSLKEIERSLEANGIGKDAEERGKLAGQMFAVLKKGFYEAIKNAPEILFVNSAGNEDNDPLFQEYIPTSFDLTNVMVVGAVDRAGDETTFTSFGQVVDVYANGYNVESFLPGGQTMPGSGTSMSSPQVANLAAKLLALSPDLKI
ncbi:MAG: S8 family serine peptidase, partial [Candidatus Aminicenantes bacterium]